MNASYSGSTEQPTGRKEFIGTVQHFTGERVNGVFEPHLGNIVCRDSNGLNDNNEGVGRRGSHIQLCFRIAKGWHEGGQILTVFDQSD